MAVLVLSDAWDPHADTVCNIFKSRDVKFYRLDLDVDSLRKTSFTIENNRCIVSLPDKAFNSSEIGSVWARRLDVTLSLQEQHETPSNSFLIWKSEWSRHLFWLFYSMSEAFWLNPIVDGGVADNKLRQIGIAFKNGLLVPPTIASNDKTELVKFAKVHQPVAIKFLTQAVVPAGDRFLGLYVNKLLAADLDDFGGTEESPIILQKYISKAFEVRYTVVGNNHYVCKIESQKSTKSSTDWRRYDIANTPHTTIEPPARIRESVALMMKDLGIAFGAFDFIVDNDGSWWFLEVNTNGQWLWIEELTGLEISQGIATILETHSGANHDAVC